MDIGHSTLTILAICLDSRVEVVRRRRLEVSWALYYWPKGYTPSLLELVTIVYHNLPQKSTG